MSSVFDREYKKLNPEQKEAVDSIEGPVLVVAGPGSGKTQLLSLRTANILRQTDIEPANILCLTFTDAAAINMRERLLTIIGSQAHKVGIYTFHSFGSSIIQNYPEYFYDQPLLNPTDQLTEYEILENILAKLPHSNPLSQTFGDNFLHLPTIINTISWLKQAGIAPAQLKKESVSNQSFFKTVSNLVQKTFTKPTASANRDLYQKLLDHLKELADSNPVARLSSSELAQALDELSDASRYAKPITAWRNRWLKQVSPGHWQFSDESRNQFLAAVAGVYEQYQNELTKAGLYTFDDMIIRTNQAIEASSELRLSLQEQYQYILVDEYQDTNGAQNKLLDLLASSPINEGRPNLMVVGDDDQAIYRFQGANSSIMAEFLQHWPDTKIVLLNKSYRSGQALLDASGGVIANASNRVVDGQAELDKRLVVGSENQTSIYSANLENEASQYVWVAQEIKKLIDSGASPSSIAVLAPKHVYLRSIMPYLFNEGVNVSYERREQVLEQPKIIELIDLTELVLAINAGNRSKINALLPKVLAADYWNLSIDHWWQIAVDAQLKKEDWLSSLKNSKDTALSMIVGGLMTIAKHAQTQPFELTLAQIMGNANVDIGKQLWLSPWQNYYFNEEAVEQRPADSLIFINQLNSLVKAFKSWRGDKFSSLSDFGNFVILYRKSGLSLLDPSLEIAKADSVVLSTVYKAKGLEWDNVFLINGLDDIWGPQTRSRNVTFRLPSNLEWIQPARENSEDLIRLFYVAMTRAKLRLYLTTYSTKDNAKIAEPLRWLDQIIEYSQLADTTSKTDKVMKFNNNLLPWFDKLVSVNDDLKQLFEPVLKSYKLSATHLNNFLSIERGGPKYFLIHNLFRVPDSLSPAAMYGNAIHQTLDYTQQNLSQSGKLPGSDLIKDYFVTALELQPLSADQLKLFRKRGLDELSVWLKTNATALKPGDISERNFNSEAVNIEDARLTGKIDRLILNDDKSALVVDYKTSRPLARWAGSTPQQAIQGYDYLRQLHFYKILVENSNSYAGKYEVRQGQVDFISPSSTKQSVKLLADLDKEESSRQKNLIKQVWKHIVELNMPDVSSYPPTLSGIKSFETDLLNGTI